jgi:hypothetical protein
MIFMKVSIAPRPNRDRPGCVTCELTIWLWIRIRATRIKKFGEYRY